MGIFPSLYSPRHYSRPLWPLRPDFFSEGVYDPHLIDHRCGEVVRVIPHGFNQNVAGGGSPVAGRLIVPLPEGVGQP